MIEGLVGPLLIDAILAIIVIEAGIIYWLRRLHAAGPGLASVVFNLLSGACLLLALRAALAGSGSATILLWLSGAFVAHLVDLRQRWLG